MPLIGRLKALDVTRKSRAGMYGDGGGLYLQVTAHGAKSWIFRYWVPERDAVTGQLVRDALRRKQRAVRQVAERWPLQTSAFRGRRDLTRWRVQVRL